jgi:hypothetical protein
MKSKISLFVFLFISVISVRAQSTIVDTILKLREQPKRDGTSISVDLTKPTDTLFFKMDVSTVQSATVGFKLAKGNKFNFGQVTMKAHEINPFNLPKIFLNNKAMNAGIYFPNLESLIFTFYNTSDTGMLTIKSPIIENEAEINFIFNKKDLVDGDNEILIVADNEEKQNDLFITNLKLNLRAPLISDNYSVQFPAEFPGGQKGWINYLERSMNTDLPINKGAPAGKYTVVVNFIVDKEGNLSDIKAENNPGYGTAEEAVRVIKNGPKWVPASQNGVNVIYRHRQAIVFLVSNN